MDFYTIIPARFASTRLPGKPLLDVAGKPLIQRVYENAVQQGAKNIVIATDDVRIQTVALSFGAEVCMTSPQHENGTERLLEVAKILNLPLDTVIVNLQGDEPFVSHEAMYAVAQGLHDHRDAFMSTLCMPMLSMDAPNPHFPKVVRDIKGFALYFSRAPIPWDRDEFVKPIHEQVLTPIYERHIGLYAYRVQSLMTYGSWIISPLEQVEKLEQLRILYQGEKIYVAAIKTGFAAGVDTFEDLQRITALYQTDK